MTTMTGPASTASALNIPLLNRLRAATGEFIPLDELGPDPGRLRGDLDALASFGFAIERHPYRGACYAGPAERLCPDQIEHELATVRVGRRIAVWSRVSSTNDLAARAAGSASNDGLVVLAEEQTAGRGRRGRPWTAPSRSSILISVLLFPPRATDAIGPEAGADPAWLTALGAVATAEVVSAWIGREAAIKWPNDVRVDGRKIAGILVERPASDRRAVVIGIGLNVNLDRDGFPADLHNLATSIQIERGGLPVDRSEVARELIRRLDHWYDALHSLGREALNAPWRDRCELLGQVVRVATPAGSRSGRLVDLDLRTGLVLDIGSERDVESGHLADGGADVARRLRRFPLAEIRTIEPVSSPMRSDGF
jgi:BirA family transcriptional regulator, biotin operon repressor / biotin---[acetyl-CoA-carboxylase] ligase